jgi:hypothetical protein
MKARRKLLGEQSQQKAPISIWRWGECSRKIMGAFAVIEFVLWT